MGGFKEGNVPWNKGLNGIHLSPRTEFKKGQKARNRKFHLTKEELHDRYWLQELSCVDIARQEGVDRSLVSRWMKRFNIPRRSLSKASKLKIGEKNGFYGKTHTPETMEKIRQFLELGHTEEAKKKKAVSMSRRWQDPVFAARTRRKMLASLMQRPTRPERKVSRIIQENGYPFKYRGNGTFLLGGLNPDFVATDGSRKLIEVFGRVFHDPEFSFIETIPEKSTAEGRTNFFKERGWETLILWDDDILDEGFDLRTAIGDFIND